MKLNEVYEISMLMDFYGKLLKEKSLKILQYYYYEDYSLSEIADSFHMTRQGVHDLMKRAQEQLKRYELALGLVEKFSQNKALAKEMRVALDELIRALGEAPSSAVKDAVSKLKGISDQWLEE